MSARKFFTKYSLFLCLICIGLVLLIFTLIYKKDGTYVVIYINGNISKSFDISEDITYDIDEFGNNTLIIKDGYAWINTANCPDKLCVNCGKISKSGESIICLPNKVVIRIESNIPNEEDLDAIAK